MIGDSALPEIMSSKPHKLRKDWYKDRIDKLKGLNVADRNLRVSRLIDELNGCELVEDEFCDKSNGFTQLSFDFN